MLYECFPNMLCFCSYLDNVKEFYKLFVETPSLWRYQYDVADPTFTQLWQTVNSPGTVNSVIIEKFMVDCLPSLLKILPNLESIEFTFQYSTQNFNELFSNNPKL